MAAAAAGGAAGATQRVVINEKQFERAVSDLSKIVSIPSVSNPTSPDHSPEALSKAADFAADQFRELGFKVKLISANNSAPYVVAKRVLDASNPTLVIYAHYDVQPVERESWKSDPFVVEERDGRLYGRGASDDKAGIIAVLAALRVLKEAGRMPPVNVTVFLEGEEEIGSPNMQQFLEENGEEVKGEALVVLDSKNRTVDTGTLTSSTRGVANLILKLKVLEKPVHSGTGVLAPDPVMGLSRLIASLDPHAIPGFTDEAMKVTDDEKALLAQASTTRDEYVHECGILPGLPLRGARDVSIYERVATEPNLSVIYCVGGDSKSGMVVQSEAEAKISVRTLPGQDPVKVVQVVADYVRAQSPWGDALTIETKELAPGWKGKVSGPFSTKYLAAMKEHFSQIGTLPMGGALPLLNLFEKLFPGVEIIVAGIEDPDTNEHSHNESQHKGLFRRVINSLVSFIEKVGEKGT